MNWPLFIFTCVLTPTAIASLIWWSSDWKRDPNQPN